MRIIPKTFGKVKRKDVVESYFYKCVSTDVTNVLYYIRVFKIIAVDFSLWMFKMIIYLIENMYEPLIKISKQVSIIGIKPMKIKTCCWPIIFLIFSED